MKFWSNKLQPIFTILCYLLSVLILAVIWLSIINHYYVPNIAITEEMINTARRVPNDSMLDEIERFFGSSKTRDSKQLIASAEMILQGKVTIPGGLSAEIGFPFDPDDLDKKLPGWQLYFARFSIPEILLSAYEATGRDYFLKAASNVILGFASYERSAWLSQGLLWNDHAIAARISVMAKFWKLYRNHPDYQSKVARDLFQLVGRSAQLLAKPAHFTFATNHGIMQNLGLWQICLAFPTLPNIELYKQVAFERMLDQMKFYVSDEGVVLEHSAGYHRAGLKFVGMAFNYMNMLNLSIPEDWKVKYQKAKDFYAQLQRTDGSLPMFGDTGIGRKSRSMLAGSRGANGKNERQVDIKKWVTPRPHSLYPLSGYSIWWDGLDEWLTKAKLSQTVVAWSYFPGHAHKHADEMSVLLWADGQNWWTNVGYWPYGIKGRSEAKSWAGSNAPHLVNEVTKSKRQTKLMGYGWSDNLAVIDLERNGPEGYVARRQVIQVKPSLWIVLDNTLGNDDQRTMTTWTTSPHINLSMGELPGSYILETEEANVKLSKFLLTAEGATINHFKGSVSPFAGWVINKPASAIVIEQPANDSWTAAIWLLYLSEEESHKVNGIPLMEEWKSPEDWQIVLPLSSKVVNIWRKDGYVYVVEDGRESSIRRELQLSKPPQIKNELTKIHTGYEYADRKYPRKRYSINRHVKFTYFILFIFLLQEIVFFVYIRVGWKYSKGLRGLSIVGWLALGAFVSIRI